MADQDEKPSSPKDGGEVALPTRRNAVPPEIRELLGRAPLLSFEDVKAYERVLGKMAEAVAPRDFLEWTWLKDIVDLGWEIDRARCAKVARLRQACRPSIVKLVLSNWPGAERKYKLEHLEVFADYIFQLLIEASDKYVDTNRFVHELLAGDQRLLDLGLEEMEKNQLEAVLWMVKINRETVLDTAYYETLGDMERLQRLIDNTSARRNALLREIERRRDALAKRFRDALPSNDDAVDAEFENVGLSRQG